MRLWTTVTNEQYYESLKADAGELNWTINKGTKRGDQVLLYVRAPVSAIVALATVSTYPVREGNPSSEWHGWYFSEMHALRMLDVPLTRDFLLAEFPAWRYWKQPRASVRVPIEFEQRIKELLT